MDESSWKLQVPFRVRVNGKLLPIQRYRHTLSKRSLVQSGRTGGYFDSSRTKQVSMLNVPSMQPGAIVQSALRYQPSREETPTPVNLPFPGGKAAGSGHLDHQIMPHDHSNDPNDSEQEESVSAADTPRFEFNYDIPKDSFQREVVSGQFSTFAKLPNNFESLIQSDNSFLDALSDYPHTDSESRHNETIATYNGPYAHTMSTGGSNPGNYPEYEYDSIRQPAPHQIQRTQSQPQQSSRLSPHYLPLHQYRRTEGQGFMRRSGSSSSRVNEEIDDDEFAGERKESGAWSQYWPTTTTTTPAPATGNKEIVAHVRVMKNGAIDQNIRRHGEILVSNFVQFKKKYLTIIY